MTLQLRKRKKVINFKQKDENETVIVYTDDLKSCEDIHVGDKVNVMKYKSWAVSSPNNNGYRYDLVANEEK